METSIQLPLLLIFALLSKKNGGVNHCAGFNLSASLVSIEGEDDLLHSDKVSN